MSQQEYEVITGIVVSSVVFLIAGFFILVLVLLNNRRKKKHIEEKTVMQADFEQELLRSQLEIQEQTLKYISQEIHDNIGQALSLAKLNLGTVDFNKIDVLENKVNDSKNLIAKAIQDLRDLSKSLNTDYVTEMGLARSIEYELEMIRKTGIIETAFSIEGTVYRLDNQKELILFRIIQEGLNNILKHAHATSVSTELKYLSDCFQLILTDNGQGFAINDIRSGDREKPGLGITNMHNRAKLIGAILDIKSIIGEGTIIEIRVKN